MKEIHTPFQILVYFHGGVWIVRLARPEIWVLCSLFPKVKGPVEWREHWTRRQFQTMCNWLCKSHLMSSYMCFSFKLGNTGLALPHEDKLNMKFLKSICGFIICFYYGCIFSHRTKFSVFVKVDNLISTRQPNPWLPSPNHHCLCPL